MIGEAPADTENLPRVRLVPSFVRQPSVDGLVVAYDASSGKRDANELPVASGRKWLDSDFTDIMSVRLFWPRTRRASNQRERHHHEH